MSNMSGPSDEVLPGMDIGLPGNWLLKVLEHSRVGAGIFDSGMRCLAVTESLAAMTGRTREGNIGLPVHEVLGIVPAGEAEAIARKVLDSAMPVVDREVAAEVDGQQRSYVVQFLPLFAAATHAVQGFCCLIADMAGFKHPSSEYANALLDTIFETAPVGLAVWNKELRFIRVNKRLAEMNGLPPEDHVGKTPKELFPEIQDIDQVMARLSSILKTGVPWLDVEITGSTPAKPHMLRSWNENFFPVRAQDRIVGVGAVVHETTAARRAENALRENEARLRDLNSTLQMALATASAYAFVWDIERDAVIRLHDSGLALPNSGTDPIKLEDVISAVLPEDRGKFRYNIEAALGSEDGVYFNEYRTGLREDSARWINARGQVERGADGRPIRLVGIAMDITAQKQHEEKIQLLMREVSHRSKNLLAVVQAVANRTAGTGDPLAFPERFGERLRGMAASHDLLVRSNWEGVDAGELAASQLAHFADLVGSRIILEGPPALITAAASQALGMALHELATNAGKYGALSNDSGKVLVTWGVTGNEAERIFRMSWRETGGPPVKQPATRGFGYTVIVQMAEAAVEGRASLIFEPSGAAWAIEAPAERVLDD